ncbi:unnamed protein product [Miscanthus lutarioriparius]|uniref:Uncharacterized protein n=1 Tax=Miscanthus lutarioriparius TaxID=422564 RepID=A0A811NYK0_9POAL|nr:unnamed protein product [Miscanthus lutarioriparius]
MDGADQEPRGHGHRIDTSLLPLKKRASTTAVVLAEPSAATRTRLRTRRNGWTTPMPLPRRRTQPEPRRLQFRANNAPCQLWLHGNPQRNSQRQQQRRWSPQRKATFDIIAPSLRLPLEDF